MTNKKQNQQQADVVIDVKAEQQAEQTLDVSKKAETVAKGIDVQKIIEEMNAKIETVVEENTKLKEELANLKTNTEEENRLLGEQIAHIQPNELANSYNPYDKKLFYEVYNEEAKATTIMTGDEVECIVGTKEYITEKLKKGEKEFTKHPYTVKLIEK